LLAIGPNLSRSLLCTAASPAIVRPSVWASPWSRKSSGALHACMPKIRLRLAQPYSWQAACIERELLAASSCAMVSPCATASFVPSWATAGLIVMSACDHYTPALRRCRCHLSCPSCCCIGHQRHNLRLLLRLSRSHIIALIWQSLFSCG